MTPRALFIAGSTGAVGRTVLRLAQARTADVVPHVRPRTAQRSPPPPRAAVFELSDGDALTAALRGRTTVLQLIGTMRKRFSAGDTYESSDIGTTRALVEAAKDAKTVDHFVLLSSVGAGRPVGAYLKAKAQAEALVEESGLPFTIFRPSAFMGEGHEIPAVFQKLTSGLGLHTWKPIPVETLAATLLHVALGRSHLSRVLEGRTLWDAVEESRH